MFIVKLTIWKYIELHYEFVYSKVNHGYSTNNYNAYINKLHQGKPSEVISSKYTVKHYWKIRALRAENDTFSRQWFD